MGCNQAEEGSRVAKNPAGENGQHEGQIAAEKPIPRKIIYSATVDLISDDFDKAEQELQRLIKDHNGYVARSEVRGSPGSPRFGNWTVRVPVDQFDVFLQEAAQLGELRRSATDSEDITDKFYDLAAHIKTDEAEEEGLRKLLEKTPNGKLEDLLAVRRELKAVRGQIEEQKGRLQRWNKQTELATAIVSIHDRKDYEAPLSPGFGTTLGGTFLGSVKALIACGRAIVLAVVAMAPWLAVLAVLAVPLLFTWRRNHRGSSSGRLPTVPPILPSSGV
jgi:hypothetical protein